MAIDKVTIIIAFMTVYAYNVRLFHAQKLLSKI